MSYDRQKLRDELIRDEGLRLSAYRDTLGHLYERIFLNFISYYDSISALLKVQSTPKATTSHNLYVRKIMNSIKHTSCRLCGKPFIRSRPDQNSQNYCSLECRLWAKVDKSGGDDACWEWQAKSVITSLGYGAINVDGKITVAHRVAWSLVNGEIPDGLFVCHKCDNPKCCNPSHLFLGTCSDNINDMCAKGRHGMKGKKHTEETKSIMKDRHKENQYALRRWATDEFKEKMASIVLKGEQHPKAKLTNEQVIEIVHSSGKLVDIAKKFGVSRTVVGKIKNGKSWESVTHGIV